MPSAVRLRGNDSAEDLRALARRSKTVNQSRRLLSLAAVRDGMDRGSAATIGGMGSPRLARLGPPRSDAMTPGTRGDILAQNRASPETRVKTPAASPALA